MYGMDMEKENSNKKLRYTLSAWIKRNPALAAAVALSALFALLYIFTSAAGSSAAEVKKSPNAAKEFAENNEPAADTSAGSVDKTSTSKGEKHVSEASEHIVSVFEQFKDAISNTPIEDKNGNKYLIKNMHIRDFREYT